MKSMKLMKLMKHTGHLIGFQRSGVTLGAGQLLG
jgi:hypothetical protein